jgi:cytochrome c553
MRFFISIVSVLFFISCSKKEEVQKKLPPLEVYKPKEMAILMEQMYVYNSQLKQKILDKKELGKTPSFISKMYTAEFTKPCKKDSFYIAQTKFYIQKQTKIYESKTPKEDFNSMVNACISCHEVKCVGPIDRIKRLYIK